MEDSDFFGPIYDEWSDMTDEELYQKALEEAAAETGLYRALLMRRVLLAS